MTLNEKDVDLYNFIYDFIETKHYAPQLVEICQHLNVSSKSITQVVRSLNKLEDAGLINRIPNKKRGITVTGKLDGIGICF